jgi:hypothetical protein
MILNHFELYWISEFYWIHYACLAAFTAYHGGTNTFPDASTIWSNQIGSNRCLFVTYNQSSKQSINQLIKSSQIKSNQIKLNKNKWKQINALNQAINQSANEPINPPTNKPTHQSINPSIHPSIYLPACLPAYLPTYLPISSCIPTLVYICTQCCLFFSVPFHKDASVQECPGFVHLCCLQERSFCRPRVQMWLQIVNCGSARSTFQDINSLRAMVFIKVGWLKCSC